MPWETDRLCHGHFFGKICFFGQICLPLEPIRSRVVWRYSCGYLDLGRFCGGARFNLGVDILKDNLFQVAKWILLILTFHAEVEASAPLT